MKRARPPAALTVELPSKDAAPGLVLMATDTTGAPEVT